MHCTRTIERHGPGECVCIYMGGGMSVCVCMFIRVSYHPYILFLVPPHHNNFTITLIMTHLSTTFIHIHPHTHTYTQICRILNFALESRSFDDGLTAILQIKELDDNNDPKADVAGEAVGQGQRKRQVSVVYI